ncbi:MAG: hypothetical protein A2236_06200 [Bacteroidetes bacterium RIFOXYA2_FULL_33_7]|nr:MAG: hypothetical protein A2236_06200 [Bacteroidetes bacterium RIFOXYA2_FULL_33_7]
MSIQQRLTDDLTKALKQGDKFTLLVLRLMIAEIKNERIKLQKELGDEEVLRLLQRQVKMRQQSIVEFTKGKRLDLAEKEQKEIEIIKKYLPEALTSAELTKIVEQVISDTGFNSIKQMGQVMSLVMKKAQGKADGSTVSEIVKSHLVK